MRLKQHFQGNALYLMQPLIYNLSVVTALVTLRYKLSVKDLSPWFRRQLAHSLAQESPELMAGQAAAE